MAGEYQRTDRIADAIRREIAQILSRDVKDPRLQLVTITHVDVARDLRNAKIFYNTLAEGDERRQTQQALKKAAGFVQRKMAQRLQLRNTPHISFVYDAAVESGTRMDTLMRKIESELDGKDS
ncbi:MAG: 30S ribosome-binding factor RbfA [Deltaproteobacteria bacterium]|nr:30S ribosome-binding factor RbfA [Deltaproteobacteria bacterium]